MTLTKQEIRELLARISKSISKVYELDRYLIDNEVHERTIVGRFAIYFQEELNQCGYSHYNMDIEYNRNYSGKKQTNNFKDGTLPDVIVHNRGSNDYNLCIIEFKTGWGESNDRDLSKLKDFTNENDRYKYGIGYSITINHDSVIIQQVEKGHITGNPIRSEVLA